MSRKPYEFGLAQLCLGLVLLNISCTAERTEELPATAEDSSSDLESPDGRILQCPAVEGDGHVKAWYAVDSMTRKLARYPSFAEYARLEVVGSCDEAIAYVRAYDEYELAHPNFEKHRDPKAPAAPLLSMKQQRLPRLKIMGGDIDEGHQFYDHPSPIVHIEMMNFWANGTWMNYFCEEAHLCTGNLIDKHWILTAAHCLQRADLKRLKPGAQCPTGGLPKDTPTRDKYVGISGWRVSWTGTQDCSGMEENCNVFFSYTTEDQEINQYPYPGYKSEADMPDHDLGLLHLPTNRDETLMPDVTTGAAAWISGDAYPENNPPSWNLRIAGYGKRDNDKGPKVDNLYVLESKEISGPFTWSPPGVHYEVWKMAFTGDPVICRGDSGGPLYRLISGPNLTSRVVLYGIASRASGATCPVVGDLQHWSRLDQGDAPLSGHEVIGWINKALAIWKDGPCRPGTTKDPDTGLNLRTWECWGKGCRKDGDCANGESCVGGPASIKGTCTGCCDPADLSDPSKSDLCDCKRCLVGRCVKGAADAGAP